MEDFFQAAAGVLIAVVLCITLGSQNKSFSVLLAMGVCAMVLLLGLRYLAPVADFIRELEALGNLIFTGPTGTNVNDVAVALIG